MKDLPFAEEGEEQEAEVEEEPSRKSEREETQPAAPADLLRLRGREGGVTTHTPVNHSGQKNVFFSSSQIAAVLPRPPRRDSVSDVGIFSRFKKVKICCIQAKVRLVLCSKLQKVGCKTVNFQIKKALSEFL